MPTRVVLFAPNWLGDVVMALPAISAVRRHFVGAELAAAARPSVAPLLASVPGVDRVIVIDGVTGPRELAAGRFDVAVLFPNSFSSAWLARRAGIPERWGYSADARRWLLTRRVARPRGRFHQSEYYSRLIEALGIPLDRRPLEPLVAPPSALTAAGALLERHGWPGRGRVVVLAPGAAYGHAKRWPPARFAALAAGRRLLAPGVGMQAVDDAVRTAIESAGGRPAFLGYRGFPASSCISRNAEVVHGIPSPKKIIASGDLVSLDVGVEWEGYYADAALTVTVGEADELKGRLLESGRRCLAAAVATCLAGRRLGDVSYAIERAAQEAGFDVVREYVGHGIGNRMHEEPQVPNYGPPDRGPKLEPGMTLALEPMVVAGDWHTRVAADGWTVSTRDGRPAVHFEHTVVVTEGEADVLTRGWEEFA